jgi:hypothetical protein
MSHIIEESLTGGIESRNETELLRPRRDNAITAGQRSAIRCVATTSSGVGSTPTATLSPGSDVADLASIFTKWLHAADPTRPRK